MRKKHGFTFAELMVVVGISSFVVGIIMGMYYLINRNALTGIENIGLMTDVRNRIPVLVRDLRNCREIIDFDDNRISMKTLITDGDYSTIKTVEYEIENNGSKMVLSRFLDDEEELFKFDEIKEPFFTGYLKGLNDISYSRYDTGMSDSSKRGRIVMVRISLDGTEKQGDSETRIQLVTRVRLDYLAAQPERSSWNQAK